RHDDREPLRAVAPPARVTGDLAAQRPCDRLGERPRAVERQPAPRYRPDLRLGRRPDPGSLAQAARRGGLAQLGGGADAEGAPELDHSLRPEPDQAAQPDQLRLHLALELVDLRDAPGLDELAQPRLDRRADPPQLADTSGTDQVGDRGGRRAHELRRTSIRTDAVMPRAREVEQRRE